MGNEYFPLGITISNIITFIISVGLIVYCYRKCYLLPIPKKDHTFYSLKLKKCVAFFIFNTIAMYVNWKMFYRLNLHLPEDLAFLRYMDRGTVLIYGFLKVLDCTTYYPSAYDHK
jgi:hypothetical protein